MESRIDTCKQDLVAIKGDLAAITRSQDACNAMLSQDLELLTKMNETATPLKRMDTVAKSNTSLLSSSIKETKGRFTQPNTASFNNISSVTLESKQGGSADNKLAKNAESDLVTTGETSNCLPASLPKDKGDTMDNINSSERGLMMQVADAYFDTKHCHVVLDSPGHKDFVPNMTSGAAQFDAAILVLDVSLSALATGMEGSKGQTKMDVVARKFFGLSSLAGMPLLPATPHITKAQPLMNGSVLFTLKDLWVLTRQPQLPPPRPSDIDIGALANLGNHPGCRLQWDPGGENFLYHASFQP